MPAPVRSTPTVVVPKTPGPLDTLPDWWAIVNASGGGNGSVSYADLRFPFSNAIAPDLYLPLAYGAIRVGGTAIKFEPVPGSEMTHGWGVVAWSEGQISSITNLYCQGVKLPAPYSNDYVTFGYAHYYGAPGDYRQDNTSDIFCPYPRTNPGSGSSGPYDTSGFGAVAYTRFDIVANYYWWQWWKTLPDGAQNGSYEWAADVEGLLLYDPRGGGSTAYSNNPALIIRDLFKRCGGLTDADLDDVSFGAAADACDSIGFTCNVVFAARTSLRDAIAVVLQTCNGTIITSSGKVGLFIDAPNAGDPVATFSEERGEVWGLRYEWLHAADRPTRVRVRFANASADYKADVTPDLDDPGIALGTVPIREMDVQVPGITTLDAAIVFRDYLYNSRAITLRISGTGNFAWALRQQGEKVRLVTLKGVDAECLIEQVTQDENGFSPFVLKPYDEDVYGSVPITQPPPITVDPPNPTTTPGGDITVTDSSGTRQVTASSTSNETVYNLFQLITYTLPSSGTAIAELRVRGFKGTGYGSKTWADMAASERVIPLAGNEPQPSAGHYQLSHPAIVKIVRTLTFDQSGQLSDIDDVVGETRIIIRTATANGALSTGVTIDVAASTAHTDNPRTDVARWTWTKPVAAVDGSRVTFAVPAAFVAGTLMVVRDGQVCVDAGFSPVDPADYSISGLNVTFAIAPQSFVAFFFQESVA